MALIEKNRGNYLSIIGGTIRMTVPEGTEKAVKREFERTDKSKGEKWELEFKALVGKLSDINFIDSDYGKQLVVTIQDDQEYILQMPYKSRYALDFMKKLPNIRIEEQVEINPFDFEDDNGKKRQGISIKQNGTKIENHFWNEEEKKENRHDFPQVEKDYSEMDSDDWGIHFTGVAKFLMEYTIKNIIPNFQHVEKVDYPDDEIDPSLIPF